MTRPLSELRAVNPRTLVWFSCGAASAVAAKLTLRDDPDALLVRCETANEDRDNYRFEADVERWLKRPVTIIKSTEYDSVPDVWRKKRSRLGENLPVIGVRDLQDGIVAGREVLDRVGFSNPGRARTYAVRVDDVLVTGRGTLLKFGLVGAETAGAIASGNIIVVRPTGDANGGTLFAMLSSEVFRPKIEVIRRGATTLLSLSAKDLAKLEIQLPSSAEQGRIAALVDDALTAYRSAIEAAEIRRALVRRLLDGRLFSDNQRT